MIRSPRIADAERIGAGPQIFPENCRGALAAGIAVEIDLLAATRWEIRVALAIAAAGIYVHYAVVFALGHSC